MQKIHQDGNLKVHTNFTLPFHMSVDWEIMNNIEAKGLHILQEKLDL